MARRTRWIDALITFTVGGGAQNTQTLFPGVGQEDLRDGTIVRTIGNLWIHSQTVAGAWGVNIIDIACGVISQEAIAVGVFPDPDDADDYPTRGWTFRERCAGSQNGIGTPIFQSCKFDVASQRKLDTGSYFIIANNASVVGTSVTYRIFGSVRTLVLMP